MRVKYVTKVMNDALNWMRGLRLTSIKANVLAAIYEKRSTEFKQSDLDAKSIE